MRPQQSETACCRSILFVLTRFLHANQLPFSEKKALRAGTKIDDDNLDRSPPRTRYQSMIATALVHPAEARSIFTGKHDTMNPVEGRSSRLCSFSRWQ